MKKQKHLVSYGYCLEEVNKLKTFLENKLDITLNTISASGKESIKIADILENSENELFEVKRLFSQMVENSTEFAEFIKQRQIEYYLAYDYGMGGIGLCSEIDGQIKWETIVRD